MKRFLWLAPLGIIPIFVLMSLLPGCRRDSRARVVVYCAHDREFAEDILRAFEKESGLKVDVRFDTEANKSVQLYEDLIREASQPRCDVHWNNEILATIRLEQKGVLQSYASQSAVPFPRQFKSKENKWTAFAGRARVLIVNTDKLRKEDFPKGLWDLTDPRFKGKIAMAKPLFGTTATQAACLFQAWGRDKASDFYRKLNTNGVELVAGNKQVAVGVGAGQYAVGITDTDDALAELEQKRPVAMIFPDADAPDDSDRGVLFIPNTVAMIHNCPNPEGAHKLIDYLLSPEVEIKLAQSKSGQIPLNPNVKIDAIKHLEGLKHARPMPVDFAKAADVWQESQEFLVKEFGLR
jgi:iron(III) transport system substrate-binding protein